MCLSAGVIECERPFIKWMHNPPTPIHHHTLSHTHHSTKHTLAHSHSHTPTQTTKHAQPAEDLVLEGSHKTLLRVRANTPYSCIMMKAQRFASLFRCVRPCLRSLCCLSVWLWLLFGWLVLYSSSTLCHGVFGQAGRRGEPPTMPSKHIHPTIPHPRSRP